MVSITPAVQFGTIILAIATLFGAMVGALVQVILNWWQRRKRRRNLRVALRAEMQQLPHTGDADQMEALYYTNGVVTPIFDANAEAIGDLTEEELTYIIPFYMVMRLASGLPENLSKKEMRDAFENDRQIGDQVEIYRRKGIDAIERNL